MLDIITPTTSVSPYNHIRISRRELINLISKTQSERKCDLAIFAVSETRMLAAKYCVTHCNHVEEPHNSREQERQCLFFPKIINKNFKSRPGGMKLLTTIVLLSSWCIRSDK